MTISGEVLGDVIFMANETAEWAAFMRATGASAATITVRVKTLQALQRHAGHANPLTLTRRDVLSFLSRDLKAWSKVTYWRSLRAWDGFAREFGYIDESIIRGIPAPRAPRPVARPITDDDVRALLAAPLSRRSRAYVLLALFEALRIHEIAKIKGQDFDHEAGWLMVVAGKGGVTRPVPIHPQVSELAHSMPEVGFWFISASQPGQPVDARSVGLTIRNAMQSAGVQGTAHQLRDTAATRMQRQVHDIRLTQALLRHSNMSSTAKYVAVSDAALQQAVAGLDWPAA
jgi:integrase/recombinase XerD